MHQRAYEDKSRAMGRKVFRAFFIGRDMGIHCPGPFRRLDFEHWLPPSSHGSPPALGHRCK
eukprot:13709996-Alexandrium_andersonii.AAC.1